MVAAVAGGRYGSQLGAAEGAQLPRHCAVRLRIRLRPHPRRWSAERPRKRPRRYQYPPPPSSPGTRIGARSRPSCETRRTTASSASNRCGVCSPCGHAPPVGACSTSTASRRGARSPRMRPPPLRRWMPDHPRRFSCSARGRGFPGGLTQPCSYGRTSRGDALGARPHTTAHRRRDAGAGRCASQRCRSTAAALARLAAAALAAASRRTRAAASAAEAAPTGALTAVRRRATPGRVRLAPRSARSARAGAGGLQAVFGAGCLQLPALPPVREGV